MKINELRKLIKPLVKESVKEILIGKENYGGVDLFEGTTPIREASSPHSPLSDQDPSDSGVDITNIPGMGNWNKLL